MEQYAPYKSTDGLRIEGVTFSFHPWIIGTAVICHNPEGNEDSPGIHGPDCCTPREYQID